jgi:hypothetical protein
MKAIYTLILVLLAGTAYGQSNLPECQGSDTSKWNNCFGTEVQALATFFGEWKDGKRHGQGITYRPNGSIWLGEWQRNKLHGKFIEYRTDGSIERSGIFSDSKLVSSQYIDPSSFTRIARNNSAPAISDIQSKLPPCQGEDITRWNNCIGFFTSPSNFKYYGGWRSGEFHGFGEIEYTSRFNPGRKYIGQWKNGKQNGKGKYFDEKWRTELSKIVHESSK